MYTQSSQCSSASIERGIDQPGEAHLAKRGKVAATKSPAEEADMAALERDLAKNQEAQRPAPKDKKEAPEAEPVAVGGKGTKTQ